MSSCSIKWCGKNSKVSNYNKDGITFHRFPKEPNIKEAWITACKREKWFPTAYSVICSRHFTTDCFEQLKGNRRRLFGSAVPTLLLPHLAPSPIVIDHKETLKYIKTEAQILPDILSFSTELSNDDDPSSNHEDPSISTRPAESIKDELNAITEIDEYIETNASSRRTSSTEKILRRKVTDLTKKLNESRLIIKRVRSLNTSLKKTVNTLKILLKKLKRKGLLTQENVSIERLKSSNQALVEKVATLKRQLIEEKKRNRGVQRNVVWCSEMAIETDNNDDEYD